MLRSLVVDADTYDLMPNSHRYAVGVTFARELRGFGAGVHEFKFLFSDGASEATTPPDTFSVTGTGAVAEVPNGGAAGFAASPNPFSRAVRFRVPPSCRVLRIFNGFGKLVRSLSVSQPSVRGQCSLSWDGTDWSGRRLPGGTYFLREEGGPLRRLLVKLNDR